MIEFKEREADIQAKILKALRKAYPKAFIQKYHSGSSYGRAGIPDIWCIIEGRPIFLEVKRPGEKPTPLQTKALNELKTAGATVAVVHNIEEAMEVVKNGR